MSKLRLTNCYGVAPHSVLYSRDISLKAKGLYTYMQSKPDGWQFSATRIALECKEERGSIEAGLKELEEAGYLTRTKQQDKQGRWEWVHVLADKPLLEKPVLENPASDNPALENPAIKQEGLNKKEIVKRKEISKATALHGEQWQQLIDGFAPINPLYVDFYNNTTERAALEAMAEKFGFEKLLNTITALPGIVSQPYAPKISKPSELKRDLGKLLLFIKQKETTHISKSSAIAHIS